MLDGLAVAHLGELDAGVNIGIDADYVQQRKQALSVGSSRVRKACRDKDGCRLLHVCTPKDGGIRTAPANYVDSVIWKFTHLLIFPRDNQNRLQTVGTFKIVIAQLADDTLNTR